MLRVQRKELERVRRAAGAGGSSSRASEMRRAEEAQTELAERGHVDAATGERDRLRIRVEAVELLVAETTRELATLWVQESSVDHMEMVTLRTEVTARQIRIDELRGLVTTLGQAAQSRSRSGASRESRASVRQYLAGSSSRWRNEEEERRHRGEASAQSGRGGGEMPPPLERYDLIHNDMKIDFDIFDHAIQNKPLNICQSVPSTTLRSDNGGQYVVEDSQHRGKGICVESCNMGLFGIRCIRRCLEAWRTQTKMKMMTLKSLQKESPDTLF
ncbi:hypothetical protein Taro_050621 [Colocasia esculenta]|uniref:Uncharacterized protein n=1 Tax=Colocasia esculenta TaxID=4460 RepID=A0A843XE97_COLES|nr:hypothetical protein [Colocasia esculenta]